MADTELQIQYFPLDQYASLATQKRNEIIRASIERAGGVIVNPPEDRGAPLDLTHMEAQTRARQERLASALGIIAETTEDLTMADRLIIEGFSDDKPRPVLLLSERLGRSDDDIAAQLASFAGRLGSRATVAIYDDPQQADAHIATFFVRLAGDDGSPV